MAQILGPTPQRRWSVSQLGFRIQAAVWTYMSGKRTRFSFHFAPLMVSPRDTNVAEGEPDFMKADTFPSVAL